MAQSMTPTEVAEIIKDDTDSALAHPSSVSPGKVFVVIGNESIGQFFGSCRRNNFDHETKRQGERLCGYVGLGEE